VILVSSACCLASLFSWPELEPAVIRGALQQLHNCSWRAGQGDAPEECTPAIVHKVADQHLTSPAIFCIMPLQVLRMHTVVHDGLVDLLPAA
jgi:hypothetical protein